MSASTYIVMRRLETPMMIAYLVALIPLVHLAPYTAYFTSVALAVALIFLVRADYVHTSPLFTIAALLPMMLFGTMVFGAIQTWMERVGFGMPMRIGVTTIIGAALGTILLDAPPAMWPLIVLLAAVTSVIREYTGRDIYLLPVCAVAAVQYLANT